MDFWEVLFRKKLDGSFGSDRLVLNTGDRHNSSINRYFDRGVVLAADSIIKKTYSYDTRYIRIPNLTFDLLVIFFDVNTSYTLAFRTGKIIGGKEIDKISSIIDELKRANIEARLIGMQNNHIEQTGFFQKLKDNVECKLMEVDLFGREQRNIIIDTKTGMTYNLLLENRIYRPGELINKQSYDEFFSTTKTLII